MKFGDETVLMIIQGWDVQLDQSTPAFGKVIIEGNLTFLDNGLELIATYIVIRNGGRLTLGTEEVPLVNGGVITLIGDRQTEEWGVTNQLNIGAKVSVKGDDISHTDNVEYIWVC